MQKALFTTAVALGAAVASFAMMRPSATTTTAATVSIAQATGDNGGNQNGNQNQDGNNQGDDEGNGRTGGGTGGGGYIQ
jgi:hypothetical protein